MLLWSPPRNGELSHPKPGRAVAGQSVAKTQLEETIGFIEEFQYLKSMKPYRGGDSSVMIDMPPPESPCGCRCAMPEKGLGRTVPGSEFGRHFLSSNHSGAMDLEAPDQELPTQHMARSRTVTMSDFDVRLPRQDTEYYCTKLLNDELDATVSMCRCVDHFTCWRS
jgi:hypothetical protein